LRSPRAACLSLTLFQNTSTDLFFSWCPGIAIATLLNTNQVLCLRVIAHILSPIPPPLPSPQPGPPLSLQYLIKQTADHLPLSHTHLSLSAYRQISSPTPASSRSANQRPPSFTAPDLNDQKLAPPPLSSSSLSDNDMNMGGLSEEVDTSTPSLHKYLVRRDIYTYASLRFRVQFRYKIRL
jgi:hypothetical protein